MATQSEQQIEKLYRDYKDHVYNYIARMTNDKQLALDITQETFIKLMQDPNLNKIRHSKAYLFTVARNLLFDAWKKKSEIAISDDLQQDYEQLSDSTSQPFDIARNKAEQKHIAEAMQKIKPNYRELLLLHYIEGLSYQEIVDITGRGLSHVKVNLHRARLAFDNIFTSHMYAKVAAARQHCDELNQLLAPYAHEEIPGTEMARIEKHLNKCSICLEDAEQLKQRRELFATLPLLSAPDFLEKLASSGAAATTAQATNPAIGATASGVSILKSVGIIIAITTVTITALVTINLMRANDDQQTLPVTVAEITKMQPEVTPPTPEQIPSQEDAIKEPAPEPSPQIVSNQPSQLTTTPIDTDAWWYYGGEPFSAKVVQRQLDETSSSDFYISKYGVRQEEPNGPGGKIVYITNFKTKKGWLLDAKKRTYVDVKLDADGDATIFPDQNSHMDNLFNKKPCQGFDLSRSLGQDTIASRKVQKWQCGLSRTRQETTQWFDKNLGLVIAEKNDSIGYNQLQEVKPTPVDEQLFNIPAGYNEVETSEFFAGFGD